MWIAMLGKLQRSNMQQLLLSNYCSKTIVQYSPPKTAISSDAIIASLLIHNENHIECDFAA